VSSWCEPWHTLVVVVKHFHPYKDCPGHDVPNLWGVETDPDVVEKDLAHPGDCKDDVSSDGFPYRCQTAYDVLEAYGEIDGPMVSGTYRVRSSGWGPDYEGDYDADTEFEPIAEAVAA